MMNNNKEQTTCKALTKKGKVCGCKTNDTTYCKRHIAYIDTSKSLFYTTFKPMTLKINFMNGDVITISDTSTLKTINTIKQYIETERDTTNVKYSLYQIGHEDEIKTYTGQPELFCLFRDYEKKTSNTYIPGSVFNTGKILFGGNYQPLQYTIVKRTKCYVTFKNDTGECEFSKKYITTKHPDGHIEESIYTPLYHLRASNFEYLD